MEKKDLKIRIYFFGLIIVGLLFMFVKFRKDSDMETNFAGGAILFFFGIIGLIYLFVRELVRRAAKNRIAETKLITKGSIKCPKCGRVLKETNGSPVSPYINVYFCSCGWRRLRCGNKKCNGFMEAMEMGYPNTVRYTCTKCGWTGTGTRFS